VLAVRRCPCLSARRPEWNHVAGDLACGREFPAVYRSISKTVYSVFCHNLQRYEIASRAANNHFGIDDFHCRSTSFEAQSQKSWKEKFCCCRQSLSITGTKTYIRSLHQFQF